MHMFSLFFSLILIFSHFFIFLKNEKTPEANPELDAPRSLRAKKHYSIKRIIEYSSASAFHVFLSTRPLVSILFTP